MTTKLQEALKPFKDVMEEAAKPRYDDKDYLSVYYYEIRAKHWRALKAALDELQS